MDALDPICANPICARDKIRWSQHTTRYCKACGFEHVYCPNVPNKEYAEMTREQWIEFGQQKKKKAKAAQDGDISKRGAHKKVGDKDSSTEGTDETQGRSEG